VNDFENILYRPDDLAVVGEEEEVVDSDAL
jgi:hypothetical protein